MEHRCGELRIFRITRPIITNRPADPIENGRVKIDATEMFDASALAQGLEPVRRLFEDGSVEGAASEVIDSEFGPYGNAVNSAVGPCCGRWFGQTGCVEVADAQRLAKELELVRAPVGGMGDDGVSGRTLLALDDPLYDVLEGSGVELFGRKGRCAKDDRCRVAEPPFELACSALGVGD